VLPDRQLQERQVLPESLPMMMQLMMMQLVMMQLVMMSLP